MMREELLLSKIENNRKLQITQLSIDKMVDNVITFNHLRKTNLERMFEYEL